MGPVRFCLPSSFKLIACAFFLALDVFFPLSSLRFCNTFFFHWYIPRFIDHSMRTSCGAVVERSLTKPKVQGSNPGRGGQVAKGLLKEPTDQNNCQIVNQDERALGGL